MNSKEIRSLFLKFFEKNNHKIISGSPIIPQGDNTILFTNAGMNQFKDIFLGTEKANFNSATTSQRCIRAGGKHNDLSNVGFTARHLTCFEMLGNFSFGSYFKKEAIRFAWDFLTKEISLDTEKLWVTVFKDDEEAFLIWKNEIGIREERIIKLGEKDNFWQMGDIGPCGPCSEIYFDRGIKEEIDINSKPGDDFSTRFIEIWNLVFMQFNRESNGSFSPLQKKGIDTGMGLERLSMVIQKKETVFDTDCFQSIFKIIEKLTGISYEKNEKIKPAFRVIADHLRTSCCIISEGIVPSNEGRGYVLRKIIRRALLFSKKISDKSFFSKIVFDFLNEKDSLYNDLSFNAKKIETVLFEEEEKFETNLSLGKKKFLDFLKESKSVFSGKNAFILYDTFGFPLEVTEVLALEENLKIDFEEYEKLMDEQRERSKAEGAFKSDLKFTSDIETNFTGYEKPYSCEGIIKEIFVDGKSVEELKDGQFGYLVLSETKFYPKGGGQISDSGYIVFNNLKIEVVDVLKINKAIAIGIKANTNLKINSKINQFVNEKKRFLSECNHTATHILQAVLRKEFGENVKQAGSYVGPDCLTFDCFFQKNLSNEEILKIENSINEIIVNNYNVSYKNTSYDDAVKNGAMAFFTEKYNKENVRTVKISKNLESKNNEETFSLELCGGAHVKNTASISLFFIKSISSVASGVKRFTALTNIEAINYLTNIKLEASNISNSLKSPVEDVYAGFLKREEQFEKLKKEIKNLNSEIIKYKSLNLEKDLKELNNFKYGIFDFTEKNESSENFKEILNNLTNKNNGVFVIFNKKNNLIELISEISKNCSLNFKNDFEEFLKNLKFKGKINEKFIQGVAFSDAFSKKDFEEILISKKNI